MELRRMVGLVVVGSEVLNSVTEYPYNLLKWQ